MNNFCTLFQSNYLSRGLALYESLQKNMDDFKLYIFAFDDFCYKKLKSLDLQNVIIISLEEFEDDELLRVKKERTIAEYCWTCTPSVIQYAMKSFQLEMCTYLDADIYFFNSPEILFEEIKDDSVIITEHRYTKEYDQTSTSGKYCVQFMTFKNTVEGLKVLKWWRDACIEWCYNRVEDGKLGDQKYLDNWKEDFTGVHELEHLGGGVAPWNIQQYKVYYENKNVRIKVNETNEVYDLIFYHFQKFIIFDKNVIHLSHYKIDNDARDIIYKQYIKHINYINKKYKLNETKVDCNYKMKFISENTSNLKQEHNYYNKDYFLDGREVYI